MLILILLLSYSVLPSACWWLKMGLLWQCDNVTIFHGSHFNSPTEQLFILPRKAQKARKPILRIPCIPWVTQSQYEFVKFVAAGGIREIPFPQEIFVKFAQFVVVNIEIRCAGRGTGVALWRSGVALRRSGVAFSRLGWIAQSGWADCPPFSPRVGHNSLVG